jgi:predicted lipid-binding transport protein (Tim44 family)
MYNMTNLFILALIAIFIVFRLIASFGKYDGQDIISANAEKLKTIEPIEVKDPEADLQTHVAILQELDAQSAKALEGILKIEATFSVAAFLKKATSAFEYILDLYCKQNIEELRDLVSNSMLREFESHINELRANNAMLKIVIVSMAESQIRQIRLKDDVANIVIEFATHQIEYKTDSQGNITSGNSSNVFKKNDRWTFERVIGSNSPKWLLVSIE